jgi:hypothetical protein
MRGHLDCHQVCDNVCSWSSRLVVAQNEKDVNTGFELLSVHLYNSSDNYRFGYDEVWQLLKPLQAVVVGPSQRLYLGEFGDTEPGERAFTRGVIAQLHAMAVTLSTVWIWEFDAQNSTGYPIWPGVDDALIADMRAFNA